MDLTSKLLCLLFHALTMLLCFAHSLPSVKPSSNNSSLVYKSCADQTRLSSTKSHSNTLSSLFEELVLQSSKSKFFKTTQGSDDDQTAIFGLFQCREDISNDDCRNCVKALPDMSTSLCKEAESARVQLQGCYIRYEPDGVLDKYSENKLLHKTCGEPYPGTGRFEEMRDAAFSALEDDIANSGGFCKMSYELVQVIAQCEGELDACECGECVNGAVQIAREECGNAVSGEFYLDKCFMTYSYYPEGVPGKLNPGNLMILHMHIIQAY